MLVTWPFVVSLAALIVNDACLKAAFPGVITGKLSDIAGISVVALLLLARFPQRRGAVYAGIAVAFAWWKSPLSQPLIDALGLARTVDFTDLVALCVMPACARVALRVEDFKLPGEGLRRLVRLPLMVCTVLALMATSLPPPYQQGYRIRAVKSDEPLKRADIARVLQQEAEAFGMKCLECGKPQDHGLFGGNKMTLEYRFEDWFVLEVETSARQDGAFTPSREKKLWELNQNIKSRLARLQPGLEYAETLGDPRVLER